MNTSASLPDIKNDPSLWGNSHNFLFFPLSPCQSKAKAVVPPFFRQFLRHMNTLPRKHNAACLRRQHTKREQHSLATLYLQGPEVTQARRLSAVPSPAAALYVNCIPLTFTIKSAALNS